MTKENCRALCKLVMFDVHDTVCHSIFCLVLMLRMEKDESNYHNVYGAIIMTIVIVSVHPVHLMNVD